MNELALSNLDSLPLESTRDNALARDLFASTQSTALPCKAGKALRCNFALMVVVLPRGKVTHAEVLR